MTYTPLRSNVSALFNATENHNPNLAGVIWNWIPQWLPYDLIDNRNDFIFPNGIIIDNVNGYINQ